MINALVFIGASGVAAYLAQRGFLAGGAPSVLLLGSGMLAFGLASLFGSVQVLLGDVNAAVTTHNIGALIAGAFHLVSGIGMPLFGAGPVRKESRRLLSLGLYISSLALLGIIGVVAWYGIFPDFMTPSGTTFLRSTVLTVTVMEYLVSALLFGALNFRERKPFLHWYSLGLGLIGIGLAGVALQPAVGSPLGWAGRISQSMGQIYALICLITVAKELLATKSSLGWRIGTIFRHIEMEHRAILEASVEGIWILDTEGVTTYANRRAREMLARPIDELVGKPMIDLISSKDSQEREKLSRWLTRPEQQGVEILHRRRDGSELWIELNASPIKDAHERAWGMLVMMSDITERKQAEDRLHQANQKLQSTLDSITDGLLVLDRNWRYTYFSETGAKMIGMRCEDLIGGCVWELFPYAKDSIFYEEYHRAVQTGQPVHFEEFYPGPLNKWLECHCYPGEEGLAVYFHDITERKRAEEALRKSEHEKSLILDNANEIIAFHDTDHNLIWANKAYLASIDMPLTQVKGKKCYSCWGLDRLCSNCPVTSAIQTGEPQSGELTPGNQPHWPADQGSWIVRAAPVKDSAGIIIGAIEVAHDITERNAAEMALQRRTLELQHLAETLEQRVKERTAELADLSAQLVSAQESERRRISYDLHDNVWQTLVAIRFSIENLFSRQDKPDWAALHKKSKEVIGNILTAVGKIRSMQGDLWPYVLDDIGMLATIEWYCREFEKTHRGLTIENRVALREEDIPSEAKIVIYRIMQEAMSNVVKHSQAKHVSLLVANKDQKVEFTVVDNGIGFDLEEKLIKRNPLEGLGLLSIKARTELSGGIFGIESAKGKGTTVRASWALIDDL